MERMPLTLQFRVDAAVQQLAGSEAHSCGCVVHARYLASQRCPYVLLMQRCEKGERKQRS